jgi:uncharacterized protein (TIGR03086 family)
MPIDFELLKTMNGTAVRQSVEIVRHAGADDLRRPTPCAGWALSDLLAHMTAQHRGFAAAATGAGFDLAPWTAHEFGDDAVAQYSAAADDVLAAFAPVQVATQAFALPELTTTRTFPAGLAIGFHLIDYVVHSWDVAVTLGIPFDPEPELLEVALPIALAVPDGPLRLEARSAFRPALAPTDSTSTMDRILAMLGRSPAWTAAANA